jgi:hypothetical protein
MAKWTVGYRLTQALAMKIRAEVWCGKQAMRLRVFFYVSAKLGKDRSRTLGFPETEDDTQNAGWDSAK